MVCENIDIQPVRAGCSVSRVAKLSALCVPSSSTSLGHFTQNISVQPQSVISSTSKARQALVPHASVTVGGQAMAASELERPVVTDRCRYFAPRSSLSAALGLAAGSDCLLTDCEPVVIHTITSANFLIMV